MSVVVPVRHAPRTAVKTITELLERDGLEVIAVVSSHDPTSLLLRRLQERLPHLLIAEVSGEWSVPQLRARGIRQARGRLIAVTEDHCSFSESWPAALALALDDPKVGAAGGPVVNGRSQTLLDWAVYLSRYASVMPPVSRGPTAALAGSNVCYRGDLLRSLVDTYLEGFWEHEFHQELARQGLSLWFEPDAKVSHGKPYRFWSYCRLRYCHGRCFADRLSEHLTMWRFQARVLACPLVPLLLWLRTARAVLWKGSHVRQWFLASPLVLVFQLMWAAGELTGYLLGAGESCSRTD